MSEDIKLCRECKHSTYNYACIKGKYEFPTTKVDGKYGYTPCNVMRNNKACGIEGLLWEAPETFKSWLRKLIREVLA